MSRHSGESLHICTVIILVSLASFAIGLSLEELSVEVQQIKRDNKELGSKIRRLQQNDVSLNRVSIKLNFS